MRTSFIIPAHNEQEHLPATLAAIHAAAVDLDYEVIVADDGSTDSTASLARSAGATVVSHDRRQIAATRNLGARQSTGDVLFFVDADTIITPAAVALAQTAVRAGAAGGGAPARFEGPIPLYAKIILPMVNALFRVTRFSGGCFIFCSLAAFDACGGWDESLYASEEITFARALKKQGRFVIIREHVTTSGRKLRTHSGREIFAIISRVALTRGRLVQDRGALDIWYGPRRPDPASAAEEGTPLSSGRP